MRLAVRSDFAAFVQSASSRPLAVSMQKVSLTGPDLPLSGTQRGGKMPRQINGKCSITFDRATGSVTQSDIGTGQLKSLTELSRAGSLIALK